MMHRREFLAGSFAPFFAAAQAENRKAPGRPALIPYPQQLEWTAESFPCSRYDLQAPSGGGFAASEIRRLLESTGAKQATGAPKIVLRTGDVPGASAVGTPEAYSLAVTKKSVTITAPKPAGLLYGVMSLRQLVVRQGGRAFISGCRIVDWPAFAWRGFMHDVGRNYQEPAMLRRFVDVMAQYKMNIFHFHLADGPGYRIECRVHPELNAPASYLPTRNPGKFYSYSELNSFIGYCAERNIEVVPEIDMPGHSAYFKRAFGVEMQDEKGIKIMEEVLNEFMDQVHTRFLHVGSDEVDVRNPHFMDRMSSLIRGRGRQVLAWHPGNPPSDKYISQVWTYGPGLQARPGIPVVDSRNNYINHVDPFLAPERLLNFATAGKPEGDDMAWGGILCHWPDINVGSVENIYRQNPVFPSLLAATETYWRGHKSEHPEYWARLPKPSEPEYARYVEFETRMLEHRDRNFGDWPFQYVRQTNMPWKLIGPFDHDGNLDAPFPPEKEIRESYESGGKTYRWVDAVGATIAINHVSYDGWFPKIRRGTVYALTYVWAPRAGAVDFWIGFNGPSRSNRRQQPNPAQGEWSITKAKVWVNDGPVAPPVWKQPGPVANAVETPLVDEDYFYREPTVVTLKAGWNKILIKAPKAETSWTWVLTCVPVRVEGDRVREVEGLRFSADLNRI